MDEEKELIKTAHNLTETALVLIEADRRELLPTVNEFLFETTQKIVDGFCVERE